MREKENDIVMISGKSILIYVKDLNLRMLVYEALSLERNKIYNIEGIDESASLIEKYNPDLMVFCSRRGLGELEQGDFESNKTVFATVSLMNLSYELTDFLKHKHIFRKADVLTIPFEIPMFVSKVEAMIADDIAPLAKSDVMEATIHQNQLFLSIEETHGEPIGNVPDDKFSTNAPQLEDSDFKERLRKLARTNYPVLLHGEPSVNYLETARMIHDQSSRADMVFVSIRCDNISVGVDMKAILPDLSTLSPMRKRSGRDVPVGSVFFQNIDKMTDELQGRFLAVLEFANSMKESHEGIKWMPKYICSIASAEKDKMLSGGILSKELYYMISTFDLLISPLRERKEYIPSIVKSVLADIVGGDRLPYIHDNAMHALKSYSWPGNNIELRRALEFAVHESDGRVIMLDNLPITIRKFCSNEQVASQSSSLIQVDRTLKMYVREKEREYIRLALEKCGGDIEKASGLLNISVATFYRKMPEELFSRTDLA